MEKENLMATGKTQIVEHPNQATVTGMEKINDIAREEGIRIRWFDNGDLRRYEMSLIGGGLKEKIKELFTAGNDVITLEGPSVRLLVRRPKFFLHAERLARRLNIEGYQVTIKKDFVIC